MDMVTQWLGAASLLVRDTDALNIIDGKINGTMCIGEYYKMASSLVRDNNGHLEIKTWYKTREICYTGMVYYKEYKCS